MNKYVGEKKKSVVNTFVQSENSPHWYPDL